MTASRNELADRFEKAPVWLDDDMDESDAFCAVDTSPAERDLIVAALRQAEVSASPRAPTAEAIARLLCERRGYNPDELEPGDALGLDGYCRNGDPAHFMWRQFQGDADAILALTAPDNASPTLGSELAGWFVHWGSRNGEAGVQPYVEKDSADRAAENMRRYRSSETTAEVVPVYYAALTAPDNASPRAPSVGDELYGLFVNHYWDSFEGDKQIIFKHIKSVLDYAVETGRLYTSSPIPRAREELRIAIHKALYDRVIIDALGYINPDTDAYKVIDVALEVATLRHSVAEEPRDPLETPFVRLKGAVEALYEWYDRDGSVGGASDVFEDWRPVVEAAITPRSVAETDPALTWHGPFKPNDYCSYDHAFADTPFGRYQIEWKGWKDHPTYTLELTREQEFITVPDDLASAKRVAARHIKEKMSATFMAKEQ